MRLAISEARKGLGLTSPNPMVGAVIVKNGSILATGWHRRDGEMHAEREALRLLPEGSARGATMYVTLEPCCHFGRTPPCTQAILDAGISQVVVANTDPDTRVAGQGLRLLQQNGVEIVTGVLENEAARLNSIYLFHRTHNRPYIVLKAALTLDGKLAARTGDAKWISGKEARHVSQALRRRLRGIVVGRETLEADSPRLNCRYPGAETKPMDKIVFTSRPEQVRDLPQFKAISQSPGRSFAIAPNQGADFLDFCRTHGIDSVLVEGGGKVLSWFIKNDLADRCIIFYRPTFMGADGKAVHVLPGPDRVSDLRDFSVVDSRTLGNNVMLDLARGDPLCLLDW
jgi:diaminohydroxyphosphoribosylaminopyrimidine deaminase/5-amino-6-(5-phosphoribosylamino)uracil reductase